MSLSSFNLTFNVHGGIRHLEISLVPKLLLLKVHGGIRHLEITVNNPLDAETVHGGIRHLENPLPQCVNN